MTREQLRDDVLIKMRNHIDRDAMAILETVLNEDLARLGESTELATKDNTNEYLVNMFLTLKGQKLSPRTLRAYKFTIDSFCSMCNKKLIDVTAIDVECYLAHLKRTNSETSLNNHRRNLSAFFSWMQKKHFVTFNPCLEIEPYKEIQKPIEHIEPTQFELIKQGCRTKRDRAMVEFFRCTALRIEESVNVKVSDIDWAKGSIVIYGEKTKCYRIVFLDDIAMYYIREYLFERGLNEKSDEYLFVSKNNFKMTVSSISQAIHNIGERVGVHTYVHLFRKTCATNIVRRGGSIGEAGTYLGHKDNTVTGKHYTYIDNEQVKAIFDKYVKAI